MTTISRRRIQNSQKVKQECQCQYGQESLWRSGEKTKNKQKRALLSPFNFEQMSPFNFGQMSGRRDSNPRSSPWQGDVLPAELLPHFVIRQER